MSCNVTIQCLHWRSHIYLLSGNTSFMVAPPTVYSIVCKPVFYLVWKFLIRPAKKLKWKKNLRLQTMRECANYLKWIISAQKALNGILTPEMGSPYQASTVMHTWTRKLRIISINGINRIMNTTKRWMLIKRKTSAHWCNHRKWLIVYPAWLAFCSCTMVDFDITAQKRFEGLEVQRQAAWLIFYAQWLTFCSCTVV